MARYKVWTGGGWEDACSVPIRVRDTAGVWRQIGHGSRVYANGRWETITCTLPKFTVTASLGFLVANSSVSYTIRGYVDGVETTVRLRWDESSNSVQFDSGAIVVIAWTPTYCSMRVDGQFVEGGVYTFTLAGNTLVEGYEITTGGPGGGEEDF